MYYNLLYEAGKLLLREPAKSVIDHVLAGCMASTNQTSVSPALYALSCLLYWEQCHSLITNPSRFP